jgi:hypothetical protein
MTRKNIGPYCPRGLCISVWHLTAAPEAPDRGRQRAAHVRVAGERQRDERGELADRRRYGALKEIGRHFEFDEQRKLANPRRQRAAEKSDMGSSNTRGPYRICLENAIIHIEP